jgi:hypothetical protein
MHSLEPEISQLEAAGRITPADAALPRALESRQLFSVRRELRAVLYVGIAAVTAGASLIVKENLDRIGPLAITLALGLAAVACYLPAIRALRAGQERRLPADFLLLLGALLASTDLGYAEHSWQLLGAAWTRHFLVLAAWHGITAYLLGSRLVLSVALTSCAAWMGADTTFSFFFPFSRGNLQGTGWSSLGSAALFVACRALHAWRHARHRDFIAVYETFAVHLAGVGALLLTLPGFYDRPMPATPLAVGVTVLAGVVALVGGIGWRRRQESFVLAALAYAVVGILRLETQFIDSPIILASASLATLLAAIALLWRIHAGFRGSA